MRTGESRNTYCPKLEKPRLGTVITLISKFALLNCIHYSKEEQERKEVAKARLCDQIAKANYLEEVILEKRTH